MWESIKMKDGLHYLTKWERQICENLVKRAATETSNEPRDTFVQAAPEANAHPIRVCMEDVGIRRVNVAVTV